MSGCLWCCGSARSRYTFDDIPDLRSKVAIVTGASSGIGLVTARELARKGCHVIFAGRSREKTLGVIHQVARSLQTATTQLEFMHVDLMNLTSVHAFVNAFRHRNLPLHILINNAGVMAPPFTLSNDGIESQFATNHVGHHALTTGLLPILEASAPSRVVMVSSRAHVRAPGIDFTNLNNAQKYFSWNWYSQSKLANILFARELTRQLEVRNVMNVYVNVVHPGIVQTAPTTHQHWLASLILSLFELEVDDGAKTQLYVATSDDIVTHNWHGEYFVPIAKLGATDSMGHNQVLGRKLWAFTEALIRDTTSGNTPDLCDACHSSTTAFLDAQDRQAP
ncbi:hypothetical protein H310_14827 [Aphanomyces invadans]|uniref:Uncharacterized protein n=1 Tax=Aphanomyces invadans TaxID=157072 RepID=A0A024T8M8_9STRA|nr:hypothetical protein H310_14827 [Aphanomyces invadans]ETV90373.1 hypothetical protein H310_14827 [Aphanomyces invadans]|eukprot:XP_008880983.1 hypothetical protein H310_14827 [Aphanomyces invadans]